MTSPYVPVKCEAQSDAVNGCPACADVRQTTGDPKMACLLHCNTPMYDKNEPEILLIPRVIQLKDSSYLADLQIKRLKRELAKLRSENERLRSFLRDKNTMQEPVPVLKRARRT